MLRPAAVTQREVKDGEKDDGSEEEVNRGEEVKEIVHPVRDGGRLVRYDLEPLPHAVQSPLPVLDFGFRVLAKERRRVLPFIYPTSPIAVQRQNPRFQIPDSRFQISIPNP